MTNNQMTAKTLFDTDTKDLEEKKYFMVHYIKDPCLYKYDGMYFLLKDFSATSNDNVDDGYSELCYGTYSDVVKYCKIRGHRYVNIKPISPNIITPEFNEWLLKARDDDEKRINDINDIKSD